VPYALPGKVVDCGLVQSHIRIEEKRFYGAFRVDEQGYWHISRNPDPTEPIYVGKPSRELEDNWIKMVTRNISPIQAISQ
jgi:hypothetical protein